MFWLFPWRDVEERQATHAHYAPDLLKDPVLRFLHKTHAMWFILMGVGLFASGWLIWDSWYMAMSLLCWGMFLRLVVVLNVTWAVNSATHIWGYRNYETKDNSRNLWWVGLLAGGEGWHNNHHACPRVAAHGQRWWEVDATYRMIWLMEKLGLAWNVVHKTHRVEKMLEQHRSQ